MIAMIWACSPTGVIGRDGTMPWHLPEDLTRFRELTTGSPVLMGRRTWDSLPERFRPLPGRRNLVLTRGSWTADGAEAVAGPDEALAALGGGDGWVIGGGEVYRTFLPFADRLEVTEVDVEVEGDTRAPVLTDAWTVVASDPGHGWHTSRTGLRYRFRTMTPVPASRGRGSDVTEG